MLRRIHPLSLVDRMAKLTGTMPGLPLRGAGAALQSLSVEAWDAVLSPLPAASGPTHIGDKIHKGARRCWRCAMPMRCTIPWWHSGANPARW